MEKTVSVQFCGEQTGFVKTREVKRYPKEFQSLSCGWLGEVNLRKSSARDFYHKFTSAGHAVHL